MWHATFCILNHIKMVCEVKEMLWREVMNSKPFYFTVLHPRKRAGYHTLAGEKQISCKESIFSRSTNSIACAYAKVPIPGHQNFHSTVDFNNQWLYLQHSFCLLIRLSRSPFSALSCRLNIIKKIILQKSSDCSF